MKKNKFLVVVLCLLISSTVLAAGKPIIEGKNGYPSTFDYSAIINVWTACTSGYLKYDGTCETPAGAGNLTGSGTNHYWTYWTGSTSVGSKSLTASKPVCTDSSGDPAVCAGTEGVWQVAGSYQPLNTKLSAIGSLANGSGFLKNDGSGGFSYDTSSGGEMSYPESGIAVSTGSAWTSHASYSTITGFWTTCSGYLKSDGTCDIPAGGGTVIGTGTNHYWPYWTGTSSLGSKSITASKPICSDSSGDPTICAGTEGVWLAATGTAADSSKLNGQSASYYQVAGSYQTLDSDLTTLAAPTAWRFFYSNGSSNITELALGADGTYLKSNGASATPSFETPSGAGDMLLASAQSVTGTKTFDTTKIAVKGSSTGVTSIASANSSASNYTATFPAETGTVCTTGSVCSGYQASHASLTSIAGLTESAGGSPYFTADNTWAVLAKGTAYQVYHMNSGATAPEWTSTLGATGTRLTAGFFTDITVTNAIAGSVTGNAGGLTGTPNITVGTISAGATGFSVDADGDTVVKTITTTAAAATGGVLTLSEGSNNGTDTSTITGAADAGTYPSFTFGGSQGSETMLLQASSDKWTLSSATGATFGITPATNIVGTLSLGTAGAAVGTLSLANATSGSIAITPITGALGTTSLVLGTTYTDTKWFSYATATGLTCNETAPAGSGDITAVGSCTTGSCATIGNADTSGG